MTPETKPPLVPPRTVFIELTSHCNMHCTFCPSDVLRRQKGMIDDARLRRFLDQLHALGLRPPVLLNVMGEPLLNKRLFAYLDLLEAEGHPVTLITNMTLLGDKEVQRQILRHGNVTLALSLQTATRQAYRQRGYPRLSFRDFFALIADVIEEKFRLGSGARLEIHISSNHVVTHDPTIQADPPFDPWPNFPSDRAERRWVARTLNRLDAFGRRLRRRYPAACAAEAARSADLYREHIGSRIAATREQLPADFFHLKDEVFWGYMPMPNVFLVFKAFELWTRDETFLASFLPADRFVYTEEHVGARPCPMTGSFGVLANGDYALCCLDYEGEMDLGNSADVPVADVLVSPRRAAIRADAMVESLCRRCRGNLFIFATAPLKAGKQAVDKFGRGFWPHEPGLHGRGGRWTDGEAWAYVYTRIPAGGLAIEGYSELADAAGLEAEVQLFQAADRSWQTVHKEVHPTRARDFGRYWIGCDFVRGRLYRLVLRSPGFVPDAVLGNGDSRRLGLAIHALALHVAQP